MCQLVCVLLVAFFKSGLAQCTVYKSVLGIHDGRLGVFFGLFKNLFWLRGRVLQLFPWRWAAWISSFLCPCLSQAVLWLGSVWSTCGVFLHLLHFALYGFDAFFQLLPVVEVYVAVHAVVGFCAVCEVFCVSSLVFCLVVFVPVLYFGGHLWVYVPVFVNEVYTLIHIDDDVE